MHLLPLRGNVYLLVGAGANITLSVGREGVLLVDAGTAQMAGKVVACPCTSRTGPSLVRILPPGRATWL